MSSESSSSVFLGLRVIDFSSGIAGPLAGMLFADFGAEVIKVERPEGDWYRTSPAFVVWNRGKIGAVLDWTDPKNGEQIQPLLAAADICIVGEPLDDLAGTALDPMKIHERHPRLVYLHTPAYLTRVPWAGSRESDAMLSAAMGIARRQASFDGGPIDSIYPHLVIVQGFWAAACAVAALIDRERSGLGQTVTVGGVHGVMVAGAGALTFDTAAPPVRRGSGGPGGSVPFYRTYQCGDGEWLFLAALTPHFTAAAFRALEITDLMEDERLEGRGRAAMLQPENVGWVIETIAGVFRTRPRSEWLERLTKEGCPVGPVDRRIGWLDNPHIRSIGMRLEMEDPERGLVVMPGIPLNLTGTPASVRSPAPTLDESSAFEPPEKRRDEGRAAEAPSRSGPLEGLRVLDLGAIIAGPLTASLLAELGADVIKVEPLTGDSFRGPGFNSYNKGQRSIALDLRSQLGKKAFMELAKWADVVVDNYRPGVLDRLGINYEELVETNPAIITLSITGFGEGGPESGRAGFDPVLQAMSGMMASQGGDSDPVFFTVPVNDVCASAISAFGAGAALFHRERNHGSAKGQRIWTSLAAMSVLVQAEDLVQFDGRPPPRFGGRDHLGNAALDRFYRTSDGWLRIQTFYNSTELQKLIDSGFISSTADESEVEKTLIQAFEAIETNEAVARLTRSGIPSAPARRVTELSDDKDLLEHGVLQSDPRPDRESWVTTGRHARFSRTERRETLVSPSLGEHTREILVQVGLSDAEIDELVQAGAAIQHDKGD